MEDSITLRLSEQRRVQVLTQLAGGVVSSGQAAELLSLGERQIRRLAAALDSDGPAGLVHGNRGRRPSNAVSEAITARVIELATTTYRGFNQHHLTEMLAEHEGIALSRSSVRRILSAAGVPAGSSPPRRPGIAAGGIATHAKACCSSSMPAGTTGLRSAVRG